MQVHVPTCVYTMGHAHLVCRRRASLIEVGVVGIARRAVASAAGADHSDGNGRTVGTLAHMGFISSQLA